MRINCPNCGERDRREFYYQGDAVALHRPASDADLTAWDDYLHNRDNPAGQTRDLWQTHMENQHLADYMAAIDGAVDDFILNEMTQIA